MVAIVLVGNTLVVQDSGGVLVDVEFGAEILMQCAVNTPLRQSKANVKIKLEI